MIRLRAPSALVFALCLAGCGDGDDESVERPGVRGALGGDARVTTLARARLPAAPSGGLAWVADELRLAPGQVVDHAHEPAFVYVRDGAAALAGPGGEARLREGDGGFAPPRRSHRHAAAGGEAVVWEVRLAGPGRPPPAGARRVSRASRSRGSRADRSSRSSR